ncbi:MAG: O-antigen ligase family protein [Fidelibacterota bacterium]|nr:MAG: O-antigen ligase family protein [Candidatus Neomarinimicrobiota bacterium]
MSLSIGKKTLIWLLLLSALLPYHLKQAAKIDPLVTEGTTINISYGIIGLCLVLILGNALRSRQTRELIAEAVRNNRFVLFYCFWLVLGQLIGLLAGSRIRINDFVLASAYSIAAFTGFYAIPAMLRAKGIPFLFRSILIISLPVALLGLYASITEAQSVFGITLRSKGLIPWLGLYETAGPFYELNTFGFVVAMGFWSALYFARSANLRGASGIAATYYVYALLLLVAVIVSWSRAMYLAIGIGLLFIALFRNRTTLQNLGFLVLLTIVAYVGVSLSTTEVGSSLLQVQVGLGRRDILWLAALRAMLVEPLFGYGFQQGANYLAMFEFIDLSWKGSLMGAHNAFLDLGVKGGVLLPLFYIGAIIVSLKHVLKKSKSIPSNLSTIQELRKTVLVLTLTAIIGTTFISYSLGGLGFASITLTVVFGICSLWPQYSAEMNLNQKAAI